MQSPLGIHSYSVTPYLRNLMNYCKVLSCLWKCRAAWGREEMPTEDIKVWLFLFPFKWSFHREENFGTSCSTLNRVCAHVSSKTTSVLESKDFCCSGKCCMLQSWRDFLYAGTRASRNVFFHCFCKYFFSLNVFFYNSELWYNNNKIFICIWCGRGKNLVVVYKPGILWTNSWNISTATI